MVPFCFVLSKRCSVSPYCMTYFKYICRLTLESHALASSEELSNPTGRSLVKGCEEIKPALISVMFSFLLRLSKVKYHWSKSRRGKKSVNLLHLMRSDFKNPHGVGQFTTIYHALAIKNKSSIFGIRGRVECWCQLNKVPVYFWLNFKLACQLNQGCWCHLWCWRWHTTCFSCQSIFQGAPKKETLSFLSLGLISTCLSSSVYYYGLLSHRVHQNMDQVHETPIFTTAP